MKAKVLTPFELREYTGIHQGNPLKPKSLQHFDGPAFSYAIAGAKKGWRLFSDARSTREAESADFDDSSNTEFLEFYVHDQLEQMIRLLSSNLVPVFREKRLEVNYCIGRTDFVAFEMSDIRGGQGFACTFSELSFDIPELRVIKDALKRLQSFSNKCRFMRDEILLLAAQGLYLVRDVPESIRPLENARRVDQLFKSGVDDSSALLPKLVPLADSIQFAATVVLNFNEGVRNSEKGFSNKLFNLNYLFQNLMNRAVHSSYQNQSIGTDLFTNGINTVEIFRGNEQVPSKVMMPDCCGVFSDLTSLIPLSHRRLLEGRVFIFDAKHKVMDLSVDKSHLLRNDFYQIVSYASNHRKLDNKAGVYGVVGITVTNGATEDNLLASREYVLQGVRNQNLEISVKTDGDLIRIHEIAVDFGQLLYDLGRSSDIQVNEIISRLGRQILTSLRLP